ncbi:hypothetical protein F4X10_14060 [Candidatus Poribacteria bacterium]|nr:hypothetical protein [Candidatus Poribacteria bacterium]
MKSLMEELALHVEYGRIRKRRIFSVVVLLLIVWTVPAYCQFADLPHDAKIVDIGVNGSGTSQTLSLTAVVPLRRLNGWAGVFGSRASGEETLLSEIVKAHVQGGFRIGTFGIEAFTDLERNITKGSALTSQIGSYIRPAIYESGALRISGGIGAFLENIRPRADLVFKKFNPTTIRWLAFSSVGWRRLNTVLKFAPEVGFKNFTFSAEPAITLSLSTRLRLRLSGSMTYNSEPLTETWHYTYLSVLRVTL